MKNFNTFIEKASRIGLLPTEKESMRALLLRHMEANPLPEEQVEKQNSHKELQHSWRALVLSRRTSFRLYGSFALLLLVLVGTGGGVAFASQNSLPGDILYPVKVSVVEELKGALALTSSAKIAWANERVSRRLEEVEELAADGKLNPTLSASIQERLYAQANTVASSIEILAEENNLEAAAEATSGLESSLRAHRTVLAQLSEEPSPAPAAFALKAAPSMEMTATATIEGTSVPEVTPNDSEIKTIREGLAEALTEVATARTKIEAKLSARANLSKEAATEKVKSTEKILAAAVENLTRNQKKLSGEKSAEVTDKLSQAKAVLKEGKTKLEEKSYADAFILGEQAKREVEEAKILIKSENTLQTKLQAKKAPRIEKSEKSGVTVTDTTRTVTPVDPTTFDITSTSSSSTTPPKEEVLPDPLKARNKMETEIEIESTTMESEDDSAPTTATTTTPKNSLKINIDL